MSSSGWNEWEISVCKVADTSSCLHSKWSGHVAFPGGRQEADDEDGHFTAMRETWEEVGLDLAVRLIPIRRVSSR